MKTDYILKEELLHILAALMPENRLALEISLCTGLRISDVLNIKTFQAVKGRFTVRELKTGKNRLIRLPVELQERCISVAGKIYVFENRFDYLKPRTRQAVFKDLKRACKLFRIDNLVIAPHSCRKVFAVGEYKRTCSLHHVQELFNHSSEAVTSLYAMADVLTERRIHPKKRG